MQTNDFMLCTFDGDTNNPKITYVAQILDVDYLNQTFICFLVDSNQRFQFKYPLSSTEYWEGRDLDAPANIYYLDTHYIYSQNLISSISLNEVGIITSVGGQGYLCYIDSINDNTDVIMYNYPYYKLSISNENVIVQSDWDIFPEGEVINSLSGAVINNCLSDQIQLMIDIDLNSDKYITHEELLAKNFTFDKIESWISNLNYVPQYTLDSTLQAYIKGVLKNSEDISVIIDSLAVDTDGPAIEEFPHGDKHQLDLLDFPYNIDPDYIYEQGQFSPRNFADEVPYIVRRGKLPDGRRVRDVIDKGDFGVAIYNGKVSPLAAMDSQSNEGHPLAEASVCVHTTLGHIPFPHRGSGTGLHGTIEIIMFPNSTMRTDANFIYNKAQIEKKVRLIQFERLNQL